MLEVSTIPQKEVVFLTDLQAASWRRPAAGGKDGLTRVLAKIEARRPRSVVIDLGTVGEREPARSPTFGSRRRSSPSGTTALVRAVVRNFGPTRADGVLRPADRRRPARPRADGRPAGRRGRAGRLQPPFTTPGDHLVEVPIDDDPLALDDRRWLVVPVRESLNVLLVDGHFKSEPFQAETDYLAQALSPIGRLAGTASA